MVTGAMSICHGRPAARPCTARRRGKTRRLGRKDLRCTAEKRTTESPSHQHIYTRREWPRGRDTIGPGSVSVYYCNKNEILSMQCQYAHFFQTSATAASYPPCPWHSVASHWQGTCRRHVCSVYLCKLSQPLGHAPLCRCVGVWVTCVVPEDWGISDCHSLLGCDLLLWS